jgi:hypothetical protein
MSTEFRGRVKQKIWVRPVCTDRSDPYRLGQLARADFKQACRAEGVPYHVASADVIADAFEDYEEAECPV